jgi:ABC-type glycerol-3-phosphate transport system substrate-binding protein
MVSVLMAGCGKSKENSSTATDSNTQTNTDGTQSSETSGEKEPVTIRFSWWGSQTRNDQTLKIVDMFEKVNPWITVECEYFGWDVYWENLSTQIASGDMPDLLQHDYS